MFGFRHTTMIIETTKIYNIRGDTTKFRRKIK